MVLAEDSEKYNSALQEETAGVPFWWGVDFLGAFVLPLPSFPTPPGSQHHPAEAFPSKDTRPCTPGYFSSETLPLVPAKLPLTLTGSGRHGWPGKEEAWEELWLWAWVLVSGSPLPMHETLAKPLFQIFSTLSYPREKQWHLPHVVRLIPKRVSMCENTLRMHNLERIT